jgi:hypothetical protein
MLALTPAIARRISSRIWRRRMALLWSAILVSMPSHAAAEPSFELGMAAGMRWFGDNVSLEEDASLSLRMGLRTGSVFTLWTDLNRSEPKGKYSRNPALVTGLRMLGQVDLRTEGVVRPYLLAGVGGLLFDFTDRTDAAFGTLTAGGGVGFTVGTRTRLFLEGTADFFWADENRYDVTGRPLNPTDRYGESSLMASAGLSVRF